MKTDISKDADGGVRMGEQEVLYRLVEKVGALEQNMKNLNESQTVAWGKINEIQKTTNDMDKKLDKLVLYDSRIADTEDGVKDYRTTKTRVIAWIAGLGIGTGSVGGFLGSFIAKIFGGNS